MSLHTIHVHAEEPFEGRVVAEVLQRAALATLIYQQRDQARPTQYELTIVITDDDALQELNRRFLGIDAPTDVLAFPNDTRGPFVEVPGYPYYLGDVVISLPRAEAQALEAGHTTDAELQLLVVHGVLHLLGYDDAEEEPRAKMWEAQAAILGALGVQVNLPD